MQILSISPNELMDWMLQNPADLMLLDVREIEEHEAFNIGGICIPLDELKEKLNELSCKKHVVLYCSKGIRSLLAIQKFEAKWKGLNVYNLSGGMEAWKKIFNE